MPSKRHVLLAGVVLLAVLPATGSAQSNPPISPEVSPVQNALGVLIVGALAILLLGDDLDRLVDRILSETYACFGWGLVVGVVFVVAAVLLAQSAVGIVVLIPVAVVFVLVAALGNAIGYIALFAGMTDSQWRALALGAVVAGFSAAIPFVGQVLGFIVGSLGIGALFRQWRA